MGENSQKINCRDVMSIREGRVVIFEMKFGRGLCHVIETGELINQKIGNSIFQIKKFVREIRK